MLYILLGEDDFSLHKALEEIKRNIGDQSTLVANTTTLDGQQVKSDELRTLCDTVPFLAEKRLVIIKGLLERFEPKVKSSRGKTHEINQQNEYKSLANYITKIPDSTVLVLIDGRIKSNNPLLRELSSKAEVKSFPLLREADLRQWIQRQVTEEGGTISPRAVDLLARLVGSNLWVMANEVNKLVLFASGRQIEEEDVKLVVSHTESTNVFALVDAVLEFKAGVAEHLLQQLLEGGAAPAYLLVMVSRQVQMIVRAKELKNQRKTMTEIRSKLGMIPEFVLRKTLEQASKYSLERLKRVYHKLLEADLAIKTGKYSGELALNILIAELCQ